MMTMMKRRSIKQMIGVITFLYVLLVISLRAEWQWSKETGWINIRRVRLGNSGKLNREGVKLLKEGRCEEATQYFISAYKTSKSGKFSQKILLNLATAWICAKKYYRAYSILKVITERYPHSPY